MWADTFSLGHCVKGFSPLDRDGGERGSWGEGWVCFLRWQTQWGWVVVVFTCGRMLFSPTPLRFTDQTKNGRGQPLGFPELSFPLCDPQLPRHGTTKCPEVPLKKNCLTPVCTKALRIPQQAVFQHQGPVSNADRLPRRASTLIH